ncbi:zinc finger, CCHC-type, retrotransposon gag domain protein [Tanacetum coccineum]
MLQRISFTVLYGRYLEGDWLGERVCLGSDNVASLLFIQDTLMCDTILDHGFSPLDFFYVVHVGLHNTGADMLELAAAVQAKRGHANANRFAEQAGGPVDAENWIAIWRRSSTLDCNDAFKTRLVVYKFEGDALAWWKAYKQAKGGDAWVLTLTWAAFKELFFLQFFPRAEQERLKREYRSIRQRASENSTEYMQRFLCLAGFLRQAAGTAEEQAKNFRWGLHKSILDHVMCIQFTDVAQVADAAHNLEILRDRDGYDRSERTRVETVITRTVSRVVTGVTVRVMTDRYLTGRDLTDRAVEFWYWTRPKEQRSAIPPIYQLG